MRKFLIDHKGVMVVCGWAFTGGLLLKLHRRNIKKRIAAKIKQQQEAKEMEQKAQEKAINETIETAKTNVAAVGKTIKSTVASGTNIVANGAIVGAEVIAKGAVKGKDVVVSGATKGKDVVIDVAETSWNWIKNKYNKARKSDIDDQKPATEEPKFDIEDHK